MEWPQIVTIFLYAMSIGIDLERHGEQKTGKHNVVTTLIAIAIGASILYAGGFWS